MPQFESMLTYRTKPNAKHFAHLLKSRWLNVALVSDVEKAFHMITSDEKDRDALQFLWINDIYATDPKLVCYRFTKVVFCLNCSPFL